MNIKHIFLIFILLLPPAVTTTVAYDDGAYCKVYDVTLNATVSDLDNDLMTVNFFWGNYTSGNYTFLAGYDNVTTGSNVSVYLPDYFYRQIIVDGVPCDVNWLEHSHHYEWFIYGDDGKNATLTQNWFDTCKSWDVNLDKTINFLDLSEMAVHYQQQVVPPGGMPCDVNDDGVVNYLDLSIVVCHYGETYLNH